MRKNYPRIQFYMDIINLPSLPWTSRAPNLGVLASERTALDFVLRVGASERPRDVCPYVRMPVRRILWGGAGWIDYFIVMGKR